MEKNKESSFKSIIMDVLVEFGDWNMWKTRSKGKESIMTWRQWWECDTVTYRQKEIKWECLF